MRFRRKRNETTNESAIGDHAPNRKGETLMFLSWLNGQFLTSARAITNGGFTTRCKRPTVFGTAWFTSTTVIFGSGG